MSIIIIIIIIMILLCVIDAFSIYTGAVVPLKDKGGTTIANVL